MRSSASRSGGPSRRTSMPKPHTARPRDRGARRPRRPRAPRTASGAARCRASPRATARPARSARRRPRCPRPSRPAPTPPRAGPSPSRSTAWWWKEFTPERSRPSTANSREPRSTPHLVRLGPARLGLAVLDRVVGDRGQVLVQRPAARDVERLRATADAEDRQAHAVGHARDLELEDVQRGLDRPEVLDGLVPVRARVEIRAAGQADAAQRGQQRGHGLDRQRRQHDRDGARPRECADVRHSERHLVLGRLALGQRLRPLGAPHLGGRHPDQGSALHPPTGYPGCRQTRRYNPYLRNRNFPSC